MYKTRAKLDVKTLEFMLDLPPEFSVIGLSIEDNQVIMEIETELEIPSDVLLHYETDEYGNIALVGLDS